MSALHVKYLLVGGGVASSAAAEAIRGIDREGTVLLVGQEINRPYHRPPLSKEYLRREKGHDELFTHPAAWFKENRVDLRTGRRVSNVDVSRHSVTLDSGEEVAYDKLLLAFGATPRKLTIPGADLPNVHYVRTMHDIERLHNAIDKAKREGRPNTHGSRGRVAVIGGGVLGVELAGGFTQVGLGADLILNRDFVWDRFVGENTGLFINRYLERHGVAVHTASAPDHLEGDGRVQRVVLSTGHPPIACDFIAACIGMTVSKELLRGTPIAAEKAILTDDRCRTNAPDVYAAGDCAAVFDPLFGKHRVLDHWDNALLTGALAGRNMAGAESHYDAVNYYFSDVFDLSISAWGETRVVDRRHIRGAMSVAAPDFIEIGIASDGRISQIVSIGHKGEDELLRELVRRRVNVMGKEESLKDPTFPLGQLIA